MFKVIGLCVIGSLLGCSSTNNGACAPIAGTYTDSETLASAVSASCPVPAMATLGGGAVTVSGPGPDYEVAIPGIMGPCPVASDGCSLSIQCTIGITDTSGNPAGTAKFTTDWTFTTTGFSGTSTLAVTNASGNTCTFNFTDMATKH
jgi:hypothetical protein